MATPNDNSSQTKLGFNEAEDKALIEKLNENRMTPELARFAFYSLLSAAMKFREMYYREDIERFKNSPAPSADVLRTKGMRQLTAKGARKIHKENNDAFERNVMKFNSSVYREIDATVNSMGAKQKEGFLKLVESFAACSEQLIAAHDINEALGLLRMYNAKEFEFIFEESRKVQADAETH